VTLFDDLACGPLRDLRDLESWRAGRLAFWAEFYSGEEPSVSTETGGSPSDLFGEPACLTKADEIVLWLGTGLSEQLTLAWMPQLLRVLDLRTEKLRIVQFRVNSSGTALSSLGMLNPHEFSSAPSARALTESDRVYLDEIWAAVTSPTPERLVRLLNKERPPLVMMHAAMRRILARYPDSDSGINRYEERLLQNTRDRGPKVPRVIGHTLSDLFDDRDSVGDGWLFWRLRRLAKQDLDRPAVSLTGTRTAMRDTEARLTDDGLRILAKQLNFVELNGIDDWIGGVHLDSRAGSVWFRRDSAIVPREGRE